MGLPADLMDKLNTAEDRLQEAAAKDAAHDSANAALMTAGNAEAAAKSAALTAHQDASAAAADALAALRAHFGV